MKLNIPDELTEIVVNAFSVYSFELRKMIPKLSKEDQLKYELWALSLDTLGTKVSYGDE